MANLPVLSEMFGNLGSRPSTVLYPFVKVPVPEGFRGRVAVDDSRCIGSRFRRSSDGRPDAGIRLAFEPVHER